MTFPMNPLRRGLAVLLTAAVLSGVSAFVAAAPAVAAPAQYGQWKVGVWPEYDDQRTLITFDEQLDQSVALPFKFVYNDFPVDAQVGMSCQVTPAGEHQCQQRQVSVNGNKQTITYTAPSQRQLYMEYYTDMLAGKRPEKRSMTYSFVAPTDITDLQIAFKEPKDAKGFKLTGGTYTQQTDSDGYTLDVFQTQNVKSGQKFTFTFSYTRPSWKPQVAKSAQNGGGGLAGTAAGGRTAAGGSQTTSLFMLVGVGALIGAFAMLVGRKPKNSRQRRRPAKASNGSKAPNGPKQGQRSPSKPKSQNNNGNSSSSAKRKPSSGGTKRQRPANADN